MSIKQSKKINSFLDGFIGFYTGEQKALVYTKSAKELSQKAWSRTGDSMRKAMDGYDYRRASN